MIYCGMAEDDVEDLERAPELDEEVFLVVVEDSFTLLGPVDLLELVESLLELEILVLEIALEDDEEVFFVVVEDDFTVAEVFFEVVLTELVVFLVEDDTDFPSTQLQSLNSCDAVYFLNGEDFLGLYPQ